MVGFNLTVEQLFIYKINARIFFFCVDFFSPSTNLSVLFPFAWEKIHVHRFYFHCV